MTEIVITQSRYIDIEQVVTYAEVRNALPRPVPGKPGQEWRPEKISVTWTRTRTNHRAWSHWSPDAVVAGYRVAPGGRRGPLRREMVDITEAEWGDHIARLRPESVEAAAEVA